MKIISGGVCAAKGFTANGIHCGIRKNRTKRDISLIMSEKPASAAAVYTTNLVKGAPLTVTKKNIANGQAQAIICNSGNANTCNANGIEVAEAMCVALAKELGPSNITVNCVEPGVIQTDMCADLDEQTKRSLCEETPLCRLGTAEDVANAVCFLASPIASFITGQVLGVDGGFAV